MDKKINILLVEDDINLGFVIKDKLTKENFKVKWATDGETAVEVALSKDFDLALLDVMLPKMDGFSLAESLVIAKPDMPFIFITAKSLLEDKIKGLKLGDDYITKPFEFEELLIRLKNVLKRYNKDLKTGSDKEIYTIGKFTFDVVNQFLKIGDETKTLTKKETDLLRLLCLHKNNILKREETLQLLWGGNDYFKGRSMDVFISKLRKYLSKDPNIQLLNIHGVGFKLTYE